MVKPFNSSVTFGASIEMQGASVTVQVTSSTSWLFSVMVRVLEIVPPISLARAVPAHPKSKPRNTPDVVPPRHVKLLIDLLPQLGIRKREGKPVTLPCVTAPERPPPGQKSTLRPVGPSTLPA